MESNVIDYNGGIAVEYYIECPNCEQPIILDSRYQDVCECDNCGKEIRIMKNVR